LFEGGCKGQVSLGNPLLPPGTVIGTNLSRAYVIRVPVDNRDRHDARNWYLPLDEAREREYLEAVEEATEAGFSGQG